MVTSTNSFSVTVNLITHNHGWVSIPEPWGSGDVPDENRRWFQRETLWTRDTWVTGLRGRVCTGVEGKTFL